MICPSGGMFGPKSNDPIVQARSKENQVPIVFVHPAEFLVTGPDGSIRERTILVERAISLGEEADTKTTAHRTVRLLVPRHKTDAVPLYKAAFHEHFVSPLRPSLVDDVRWYFQARRNPPAGADERFDQATRAFGAPRFHALYRAWLERGDSVLEATLSTTLADAIARETGRLECHVLPHRYVHLLPLVGTA